MKTIDLSACEREPVHVPGAIQTHGFLVAFQLPTWTVAHVSANAGRLFGQASPEAMIGLPIDALMTARLIHDLRNTFQAATITGLAERLSDVEVGTEGLLHDLFIHASGPHAVVEAVPVAGADTTKSDPSMLVKAMMDRLRRTTTLASFLTSAVRQIRAITGYDRVMIYQFLEDGSGEVVSEALRSGLEPYLRLHYPASDIPAQARALYKRQWLRLIPDVNYAPIALIPDVGANGLPLDLSLAGLRSASPIHLQYLRNMGSAATLTVSIMDGDALWGLIACHHQTPRRLSTTTCAAMELFAMVLSPQIEAKRKQDQLSGLIETRRVHDALIASMTPEETVFDNLPKFEGMLREMIACEGVGVLKGGRFEGMGRTPPEDAIGELVRFLTTKSADHVFATDALGSELPDAARYADRVAGLIALPIPRSPRDVLLLFRPAVTQTVLWGGDPNKPVDIQSQTLGPRKSFAAWREVVHGKSLPWPSDALAIAETLRISLLNIVLRRADFVDRERRLAQESQTLLVAELNHRIKNVLAVVSSLVRQSRQDVRSVAAFADNLQNRLQALSTAHDQLTRSHWRAASLRTLIEAEARAWVNVETDRLTLSGPPVMVAARAYQTLALVLHEMMTNAAKYGSLSAPGGTLDIVWRVEDDLVIAWTEAGGPSVSPPSRRGFGTIVTQQSIAFELHGTASVDYRPEGVQARFTIPAALVHTVTQEEGDIQRRAATPMADLLGKNLLLVEDSMMIALDAQTMLQGCGADVELVSTTHDAKRALDLTRFDAAILDVNLFNETSFSIAENLQDHGIPFVFATGYGELVTVPERFKDVSIVSKPYAEDMLRAALAP